MRKNYLPVMIIGAPRSGTNMLRDALTSIQGISTWPCDEINYIWRHGNVRYPNDEIPPHLATAPVSRFIRSQFDKLHRRSSAKVILEKTCANSLRVPFVDRVFPEAKYIFIYRDGVDAAASAKLRWNADLDMSYILEKAKYVPKLDLPYYASRYIWSRIYRILSGNKRLAFWGPCLPDMQSILRKYTLDEVCALQWKSCVEKSEQAFASMPADKVLRVKYENFIVSPENELKKILTFIQLPYSDESVKEAVAFVSPNSLNKGRNALGHKIVERLESLIGDTLERHGYAKS